MRSVNTCLEIDLLGQISSESIGAVQFSGTGGCGGLRQRRHPRKERTGHRGLHFYGQEGYHVQDQVPAEPPGSAVTIHRNLADTIVTEYGIAELKGLSVPERAGR